LDRLTDTLKALIQPLLAIVVGLIIGAIAILIVGGDIVETYTELWRGAFGSFYFTMNTFARATPIILVGLGVALAFRAGFFNMGSEGQMVLGALSAALTALYIPGPGFVKMIAAILAGMIAAGLWSALAGWLDSRFGMNLLITTLLLNYIATLFTGYMVTYPFKDRTGSALQAQTEMIDSSVMFTKLFKGMTVHSGFIIAIVLTILLHLYIKYTSKGYEIRMMGGNPLFASYGGVNRGKLMVLSMFASGAFAGLAGASEVLGTSYRFLDGSLVSANFAWSGIMATLLANSHPIGTAVTSVLLAALQTGGMGMERNTDVPSEISSIIQAVLILFISARITISFIKRKKAGAKDGSAT